MLTRPACATRARPYHARVLRIIALALPLLLLACDDDPVVGPVGPPGDVGKDGAQGPMGNRGATGPQGPRGERGDQGPQGNVGAQGPQGPSGPIGPQGERGAIGLMGPAGPQGAPGPQGAIGPTGADGATGLPRTKADLYEVTSTISLPPLGSASAAAVCADENDILLTPLCTRWGLTTEDIYHATEELAPARVQCTWVNPENASASRVARAICISVP